MKVSEAKGGEEEEASRGMRQVEVKGVVVQGIRRRRGVVPAVSCK